MLIINIIVNTETKIYFEKKWKQKKEKELILESEITSRLTRSKKNKN